MDEDFVIGIILAHVEFGLAVVKGSGGSMAKKLDRTKAANWNAALWLTATAEAVADAGKRYSGPV